MSKHKKLALLADPHLGAREGKPAFHNYFERFYVQTFFPYLLEHDIKKLAIVGDLFDKRKFIDFYSLSRSKEYFFELLKKYEIEVDLIVGNHDSYLKNTLNINSPSQLLNHYDNITVIDTPQMRSYYGVDVLTVPWICANNAAECYENIKSAPTDICFGHFDIGGFMMYKDIFSQEGIDRSMFDRFDIVLSGHFHHRSTDKNITYLGSPYQITLMDQGSVRGFHVLDLQSRELEFIHNPFIMFARFSYDDTQIEPLEVDFTQFKDKYVKIIVVNKQNLYAFDSFIKRVLESGAHDVKIVDDAVEFLSEEALDDSVNVEDTITILDHYVKTANVSVDREELSRYMKSLYVQSVNIQT